METHGLDGNALRAAFAHIPSGVVAVCAATGGTRIGMAASSFVAVSLDPPLIAVCVQNSSRTWPVLKSLSRLGISVLSSDHSEVVRVLAAKEGDRFAGVETETRDNGAVLVCGGVLLMEVSVQQEIPAGDHLIVVMQIEELRGPASADDAAEPIVFHRSAFRQLVTT